MKFKPTYSQTEFGIPDRGFGQNRFDRRMLAKFDYILLILILILSAGGLANLYSSTAVMDLNLFRSQFVWLPFCFGVMLLTFAINYSLLEGASYKIYIAICILLLAVDLFGHSSHGAQRWLNIGLFKLQPSEFSKVTIIFALSQYFYNHPNVKGYSFRELLAPIGLVLVPFALVLKQPDLGTAGIILLISMTMFIYIGVLKRVWIAFSLLTLVSLPIIWFVLMQNYQKMRILTLFNPAKDPLKSGYHINQSLIAIGSGRWWGAGYLKGTQSGLRFLPEQHTDFTFSVFAEEWGFIGSSIIILLFLILVSRGLIITARSKDRFGALLSVGITAYVFWQVVVNIGMCLGIFPVVGVPLPFFSYGRSALLSLYLTLGMLLNISSRRFMF